LFGVLLKYITKVLETVSVSNKIFCPLKYASQHDSKKTKILKNSMIRQRSKNHNKQKFIKSLKIKHNYLMLIRYWARATDSQFPVKTLKYIPIWKEYMSLIFYYVTYGKPSLFVLFAGNEIY
jgi:hypothetical protein